MLLTSIFGLFCNLYIMKTLHSEGGHGCSHDHGHGHHHGHKHNHDHSHDHHQHGSKDHHSGCQHNAIMKEQIEEKDENASGE